MMASQPGICSERCQRNSTCSPRTAPTAWYASSSQFEPGNTTTPNFIARNLPKKILAHQRECFERRNSGEAAAGEGYRRRDFFVEAEDLRRGCSAGFFAESRCGSDVFAAADFDSDNLARRAAAQPGLLTWRPRAMARASAGMSSVTVEPAAIYAPSPTVMGATSAESLPTKTRAPMRVGFFLAPSKLQVIVPAPMFESRPMVASPR